MGNEKTLPAHVKPRKPSLHPHENPPFGLLVQRPSFLQGLGWHSSISKKAKGLLLIIVLDCVCLGSDALFMKCCKL